MNKYPLVSIVIPVYNGANYVSQAIESALVQTWPHLEVIVVDDGSTDGGATRAAVERFGNRIRYFHKPNGGVATALNLGIAEMRGELFSWLSHDDSYKPDKVTSQVEAWQRFGQPCIVLGDVEIMDEQGITKSRTSAAGRNLVARPLDAVFSLLINGCALLVPRNLFDQVGTFEPGLPTTQDYHLWYRMARVVPFVHCPYADVRQRVHPLQGSAQPSHIEEAARMFIHVIQATPVSLMQAYDGSEMRFLMKIRTALDFYAGVQAYLATRIERLLRQFRYGVVLCTDGVHPVADAILQLRKLQIPPAEIAVTTEAAQTDPDIVPVISDTCPGDVVSAAHRAVSPGVILFLQASRIPSETAIRAAIEKLIVSDADVVRPASPPPLMSPLDGLAARRSALPVIGAALRGRAPDPAWDEILLRVRTSQYVMPEPIIIHTPEEISFALSGHTRLDYHYGFSEAAVADLLASPLNPELPTILFMAHTLGGGSQTLLNSLLRALRGKVNCLTLYGTPGRLCLSCGSENRSAGIVFRVPEHLSVLVRMLHRARVARVDVHHTMGFDKEAEMLLDALGVPLDVTLVDYHLVANHPHLCREDGRFVGDALLRDPAAGMLRPEPLPVLRHAERVIAISRDLAARMDTVCPGLPLIPVRLWRDSLARVQHVFIPEIAPQEPLRVVVAGQILAHKGRDLIAEVARIAAGRNLPIRLHVAGDMQISAIIREETAGFLTVHGHFAAGGFSPMLGRIDPHLGWLPAQVPETWSYVLSELMDAALPVAAAAVGSIPERCYGRPATWLLPWDAEASCWVDLFLRLHATRLQEPPRWTAIDHLKPARLFYFEEYLRPVIETPVAPSAMRNEAEANYLCR